MLLIAFGQGLSWQSPSAEKADANRRSVVRTSLTTIRLRLFLSLSHCGVESKSGTIRSSEGPGNQLRVNPKNFFAELKRRNVYKAAIAYGVVAWLLMQVASQIFPFFEIPNWAVRLVVLLLILGFPIALVLAWAFDLTPEGLKRTEWADREPARPSRNKAWRQTESVKVPAKSIAVMPFENRSKDKANAYFADGIQDEILTLLI